MDRRSALKSLGILAGGILILPSSLQAQQNGLASIQLSKLHLTLNQEKLLAEIAETLIPATTTPGAKTLKLHLYVMKMVNDCHEKEEQDKFMSGLNKVEESAIQQFNKSFISLTATQRKTLLLTIEAGKNNNEDVIMFYNIMKNRTIQGYMNSKYVMTNLVKYELVPGRYNGYFPVKV